MIKCGNNIVQNFTKPSYFEEILERKTLKHPTATPASLPSVGTKRSNSYILDFFLTKNGPTNFHFYINGVYYFFNCNNESKIMP